VIGIATSPSNELFAAELFELFKTPWEPAVRGRKYPVVVSTDGDIDHLDAGLFLVYSPNQTAVDRISGISLEAVQSKGPVDVRYSELTFPVYGQISTFSAIGSPASFTIDARALECRFCAGGRYVRRIGYDLFDEIRYLLTEGQPATHALVPTIELHIESLRRLLLDAGVSFVEIPPRPDNYDFIGCLTHDVDFFGIRRHRFDRTLAGFVARASFGTLADLLKGRRSLGDAGRNWAALLTLPFVLLGLARDFWLPFQDYARVEESSRSTFFLVPFKGRPGKALTDAPEPVRAAPYGIGEVRGEVGEAHDRGTEIAVHGIDAWSDADAGRAELAELLSVTGQRSAGIRMHWLYFDKNSPAQLEKAGFDYDSTWGYNEAVGYRAGTSQAFRFPQCHRLMELPMSIMDTALFYPGRMGLAPHEASQLCRRIVTNSKAHGGTVVINWHGRSLAPERSWGGFYQNLRTEMENGNRVWFTTAASAVDWFRWRRSIRFASSANSREVTVTGSAAPSSIPAAVVKVNRVDRSKTEEFRFEGGDAMRLHL
jgi:hypothetical protein